MTGAAKDSRTPRPGNSDADQQVLDSKPDEPTIDEYRRKEQQNRGGQDDSATSGKPCWGLESSSRFFIKLGPILLDFICECLSTKANEFLALFHREVAEVDCDLCRGCSDDNAAVGRPTAPVDLRYVLAINRPRKDDANVANLVAGQKKPVAEISQDVPNGQERPTRPENGEKQCEKTWLRKGTVKIPVGNNRRTDAHEGEVYDANEADNEVVSARSEALRFCGACPISAMVVMSVTQQVGAVYCGRVSSRSSL